MVNKAPSNLGPRDGDYGCRGASVSPGGTGRPRSNHVHSSNISDESETGCALTLKSTRLAPLAPSGQSHNETHLQNPHPFSTPASPSSSISSRGTICRLRNLLGWQNTRTHLRRRQFLSSTFSSTWGRLGEKEQNSNRTVFRRVRIFSA